jgi:hypothetical protein
MISIGEFFQAIACIKILAKKSWEPSTNVITPFITPILGVLASALNSEATIRSVRA